MEAPYPNPSPLKSLWIIDSGCVTAAGATSQDLWQGLISGRDFSHEMDSSIWEIKPSFKARVCQWPGPRENSAQKNLVSKLAESFYQISPQNRSNLSQSRLGILFASTKGSIDDWVWNDPQSGDHPRETLTPVLREFIERVGLTPVKSFCVSNACASALSALYLAQLWIRTQQVDQVLLLAADCVGPFVTHGFQSLQALTQERCRPFSPERSGLQLGEAAAAVLLSSQPQSQQDPRIKHVGVDAEGSAVTRSLSAGASLARACVGFTTPDLVIAHGTGTRINDPIEDKVLSSLFDPSEFWVTATKGCIGHTLGASGAIDLIAACEVLKNQRAFGITHFTSPDPEWNCRYLAAPESKPWSRIMMTSLGFGGIHAAAMIELESTPAPRSTA